MKEEFCLSFENKVALVTGAGSGMGLATAKAFAEAGASVVLADANEESISAAAKGLVSAGHKALAVRCDVADDAQVAAMVEQAVSTFGQLDAAFNNAGVQSPGRRNGRCQQRRIRPRDCDQSSRCLELHEI